MMHWRGKVRFPDLLFGGVILLGVWAVIWTVMAVYFPSGQEQMVRDEIRKLTERSARQLKLAAAWYYRDGKHHFVTSLTYTKPDDNCQMFAHISLLNESNEEVSNWLDLPERLTTTGYKESLYPTTYTYTSSRRDLPPGVYRLTRSMWGYCDSFVQRPSVINVQVTVGTVPTTPLP